MSEVEIVALVERRRRWVCGWLRFVTHGDGSVACAGMRAQNGEVSLNVRVDGDDGAPPLLLLHGILGCAETWDWMVPRVADRYRVFRLDFRGHGDSDRAAGRYKAADYVADAAAVCEQLAGRPVAVVGHSLGGGTAAGLAQTRPDLVRGAVLEDAPFVDPTADTVGASDNSLWESFRLLRESIPQVQAAGMTAEQLVPVIAMSPYAGGGTLGDLIHDDGLLTMAMGMARVDATVLDPVLAGELTPVHDPLQPIDRPIVAVAADPAMPDALTRQSDLERLAARCPHVATHTLLGANHLIHDTDGQREPFWAIVEGFLADLA
ncbi:MAG: alpha/beta hydrolase [Actinomycetota bacterium]